MTYARFCSFGLLLFGCYSGQSAAQPGVHLKAPRDDFSKAFLHVYNDAAAYFPTIKGKEIKLGTTVNYSCKKAVPGCKSALITGGNNSSCVFDYGAFHTLEEAEVSMLNLSNRITVALSQRAMVRYIDSSDDVGLVKRTAIAEIKEDGFYGYNVLIDVFKRPELPGEFCVRLIINGGEGTFYRLIHRGEPLRSPYFKKAFAKMQTQFDESVTYSCLEQLPGFTCSTIDSNNKQQLLMEKEIQDLPDGMVELECLISSIRSMLGENFLYYFHPTEDKVVRKVVFIRFVDHDLTKRKSIAASLEEAAVGGYKLKLKMYHP